MFKKPDVALRLLLSIYVLFSNGLQAVDMGTPALERSVLAESLYWYEYPGGKYSNYAGLWFQDVETILQKAHIIYPETEWRSNGRVIFDIKELAEILHESQTENYRKFYFVFCWGEHYYLLTVDHNEHEVMLWDPYNNQEEIQDILRTLIINKTLFFQRTKSEAKSGEKLSYLQVLTARLPLIESYKYNSTFKVQDPPHQSENCGECGHFVLWFIRGLLAGLSAQQIAGDRDYNIENEKITHLRILVTHSSSFPRELDENDPLERYLFPLPGLELPVFIPQGERDATTPYNEAIARKNVEYLVQSLMSEDI